MIKILFFIETLTSGGAEKVLRDLVNHMDQSKFDITVQTVWPCDAAKYLVPGIRYKSMYASESKANHLRYRVEAESGLAYRLHIKDDYDIECAYLEMGPTKVLSASTNKKAKKLAWVHCDITKAVSDPEAFAVKAAPWYAKFDQIVCVSQNVKESFDNIFHNEFHSEVLYNVIDDDHIRRKSEAKFPQPEKRRITMAAVGTMYPPKNYLRLLKAHERLLLDGIKHDLWIIGDGEDRPAIERFIQDHGLIDSVKLFGFQQNPYPYMKTADMIVCSSNYEGFSTVITEALILGKPIVTTDCSGMRELLGDREYGLITENSDEAFYAGLKTMLSNADLRNNYAEKAAVRGNDFSLQELISKSELFFLTVVDQKYEN